MKVLIILVIGWIVGHYVIGTLLWTIFGHNDIATKQEKRRYSLAGKIIGALIAALIF
jgi:uncharacterized membrane protein YdcZ (DUF606 family)